jgi:hypothetical protein
LKNDIFCRNGNAVVANDRRNNMLKKQREHEEMQRQQNARKFFEQPQKMMNGHGGENGKAVPAKIQPTRQRLEMNASLDEQAENFEKSLKTIEQQQQAQPAALKMGRGQPPPAIKLIPEKLELEKENINGIGGRGKTKAAEDDEEEEEEEDEVKNKIVCECINYLWLTFKKEEQKPMKAPPPMIPTNIFSPTEKQTMEFPEPEKPKKEPTPPPPEPEKPKKVIIEEDDGGGGGFAAMLQRRAKKMESGSTLRKIAEPRASESEQKWKEAGEKLKEGKVKNKRFSIHINLLFLDDYQ